MATCLSTRSILSVALFGTGLVFASACDQPRVKCVSARGDYAAKYTLVSGTGDCSKIPGEILGLQAYSQPGPEGTPNFDRGSVAIQPATIGDLAARASDSEVSDPEKGHTLFSVGDFSTGEPDAADFCVVPKLSLAQQDLPLAAEIPADPADPKSKVTPEQPATKITYEWSNVRIYVNAAAIGTQLSGDLTYTRDGCTAKYKVAAVYPAHPCADEMGAPSEDLCAPEANAAKGIEVGSGISPDFPVKCDPDLLLCVLTKEPPALK